MAGSTMTGNVPMILRRALVAVGAMVLAWFVGAQGLSAMATRVTQTALLSRFNPATYPGPGSRLAQILLEQGQANRAATLALPAALANPIDVRAVRVLGLALEVGNKPSAPLVMRAAERLSWRDTRTSLWVLRDAALNRDVPRVLNQIDALARRQVQSELTSKVFYAGISDPPSREAFAKLLASNPPWRSSFFANIRVNLPPVSYGQMELLLNQLDRTNSPPSAAERLTFIDRMVDTGASVRARHYWLRTFAIPLAGSAQAPYDSRFRAVAMRQPGVATSPFDWAINQDASQFLEIRQTDEGPVLDIAPGAPDGTALMSQVLTLAPGSHRIATVLEGPADRAPAGWQVACAPSGTALIRTFARAGDELSRVTVDVPANGCATQRLILTANGRIGARPISLKQVAIH